MKVELVPVAQNDDGTTTYCVVVPGFGTSGYVVGADARIAKARLANFVGNELIGRFIK